VQWAAEESLEPEDDGALDDMSPATPTPVGIKDLRAAYYALKRAKCDPQLLAHAASDLEAAEEAVRRAVPPHKQIRVLHNEMHVIGVKLGSLHLEWEKIEANMAKQQTGLHEIRDAGRILEVQKAGLHTQVDMLETANGIRPGGQPDDTQDALVCKLLGIGDISVLSNSPLLQQLAEVIGQIKHTVIPDCSEGASEDITMEPRFKFGSVPMPTFHNGGTPPTNVAATGGGGSTPPFVPTELPEEDAEEAAAATAALHADWDATGPGDDDAKKDFDELGDPEAASVAALARGGPPAASTPKVKWPKVGEVAERSRSRTPNGSKK